jgi:hypothetical protein
MIQAATAGHVFLATAGRRQFPAYSPQLDLWLFWLIILFVVYLRINDFFFPKKCSARIMNWIHPSIRSG